MTDVDAAIAALHAHNTGRPSRCLDCDVTFLRPLDLLEHLSKQHPRPQEVTQCR